MPILCTEYTLHTYTHEARNGVQGRFHHQPFEQLKNCQAGAVWTHAQQTVEVIACLHMLMFVIPSQQPQSLVPSCRTSQFYLEIAHVQLPWFFLSG